MQAGFRPPAPGATIKDCLQYASLEDKVTALKHEARITEEKPKFPAPKCSSERYCGFETQVSDLFTVTYIRGNVLASRFKVRRFKPG